MKKKREEEVAWISRRRVPQIEGSGKMLFFMKWKNGILPCALKLGHQSRKKISPGFLQCQIDLSTQDLK